MLAIQSNFTTAIFRAHIWYIDKILRSQSFFIERSVWLYIFASVIKICDWCVTKNIKISIYAYTYSGWEIFDENLR